MKNQSKVLSVKINASKEPFAFMRSYSDVKKYVSALMMDFEEDTFLIRNAKRLFEITAAYLIQECNSEDRNLSGIEKLLNCAAQNERQEETILEIMINDYCSKNDVLNVRSMYSAFQNEFDRKAFSHWDGKQYTVFEDERYMKVIDFCREILVNADLQNCLDILTKGKDIRNAEVVMENGSEYSLWFFPEIMNGNSLQINFRCPENKPYIVEVITNYETEKIIHNDFLQNIINICEEKPLQCKNDNA